MSEKQDPNWEWYSSERRALVDAEFTMAQKLDSALLTLSGGAFGLSIAFINQIAPNPAPCSVKWAVTSWVSLVVALLATVVSMWTSQPAYRRARDVLDKAYGNEKAASTCNGWTTATWVLTTVAVAALGVGALALAGFAALNLGP